MRILHLMNHCSFGHGNVHGAVDLACAQAARGDVVCVASGAGELTALLAANGVRHVLIDQQSGRPFEVAKMILALRRLIAEFEPDIVHAHMRTGAAIGWLSTRLSKVRLITTVHNSFDKHALLMALGDLVVAVSKGSAAELLARGFPKKRLRVVLNGTFEAVRRDFFPRDVPDLRRPNIGSMGGLHGRKGVPDLIQAFALIDRPEVTLYIAGDGPARPDYEALAAASGVGERIHFIGQLRDTKAYFEQIDIFALPSHSEPFGLVLTEAQEGGCAIVATNVGGVPEALGEGAGLLVPPKRPDLLAQALSQLLDHPDELERLKGLARKNLERWSVRRVAAEYHSVYEEALHSASKDERPWREGVVVGP